MSDVWENLWIELRRRLTGMPRCSEHPEFPSVRTLVQESTNDILSVDRDTVRVRSHRTGTPDEIPASTRKYPAIIFKQEREAGDQILHVEGICKSNEDGPLLKNINIKSRRVPIHF